MILNTITNTTLEGTTLKVDTFYQRGLNYVKAFIAKGIKFFDLVDFKDGELGIKTIGWEDSFSINSRGELVVISDNANKYAIDSNGNLTSSLDFDGSQL
jgi:hypothetical protein